MSGDVIRRDDSVRLSGCQAVAGQGPAVGCQSFKRWRVQPVKRRGSGQNEQGAADEVKREEDEIEAINQLMTD